MTGIWAVAAVMSGVVAVALSAVCLVVLRRIEKVVGERQGELEEKVSALEESVRMMELCLADLHPRWSSPEERRASAAMVAALEAATEEEQVGEAMEPEIQAAVAAAAVVAAGMTAGRGAVVKSVREAKRRDEGSVWSQQGRALVQGSHNLLSRR